MNVKMPDRLCHSTLRVERWTLDVSLFPHKLRPILIVRISILACFLAFASAGAQMIPSQSIVYVTHDPAAIEQYRTDPARVRSMVNRLVLAVTGQPDLARAWGSLVAPQDKVGIKISAAGGELFTTHRDIVNAIVSGLVAAGHPRENIVVWDRSLGGIKEAGYTSGEGYLLKSIPPHDGYDPKATISAPYLGNLIWGDFEYIGSRGQSLLLSDTENTSSVSHLANIVAHDVTKIINLPVLSNSERNGIAGCLYNVT